MCVVAMKKIVGIVFKYHSKEDSFCVFYTSGNFNPTHKINVRTVKFRKIIPLQYIINRFRLYSQLEMLSHTMSHILSYLSGQVLFEHECQAKNAWNNYSGVCFLMWKF